MLSFVSFNIFVAVDLGSRKKFEFDSKQMDFLCKQSLVSETDCLQFKRAEKERKFSPPHEKVRAFPLQRHRLISELLDISY